jgi:hypothetical protein
MAAKLKRMKRVLPRREAVGPANEHTRPDAPRRVRRTVIDFSSLHLPSDVALALAEATLVDHYYSAYREANTLLQRRERELADLRRSLTSKPTTLGRSYCKVISDIRTQWRYRVAPLESCS